MVPADTLSPRQAAVLELLARGRSNRKIASDLNIEEITVKAYLRHLRTLHVESRLEAVAATRGKLDGRRRVTMPGLMPGLKKLG